MSEQHQTHSYFFNLESCLCPCILLGNIDTKLYRESPSCKCTICPECELGPQGYQSCLYTCFLTIFGWPISPCLSMHLLHMRHKFKLLYQHDDRLKLPNSSSRWCHSFCCWCTNLREQYRFAEDLWLENQLTFHWDFSRYKDHNEPRPILPTRTVLIFAPQNFSSTTFMNKILRHTSAAANLAAIGSTKQLKFPIPAETLDLEHVELVETGIKTHMDSNGDISFLEVWKIPPGKLHSENLAKSIDPAVVSYYIFDLTDKESTEKIKQAYTEHGYFSTGRRLAIVLNDSQKQSDQPADIISSPMSSKKKKSVAFSFDEADNNPHNGPSIRVSPRQNFDSESPESSPLVSPAFKNPNKTFKDLQFWARQHSAVVYEVSLTKPDDFSELYTILSESLKNI